MMYLGAENCQPDLTQAQVAILPVPFEFTTSYGTGTKKGPEAIIAASPYLEFYDEELDFEPWLSGIYTAEPVPCHGRVNDILEQVSHTAQEIVKQNKFLITLGGEHTISAGLYTGIHKQFDELSVLQLDAHSDLRDTYEGDKYSHACVMRRIWEINPNIFQLGIRSLCAEEKRFISDQNIKLKYAQELHEHGFSAEIFGQLRKNIYLTIDVDFFDPAVIPSTGTPEPGGFGWVETMDFLRKLFSRKNIVAVDVVELSPNKNHTHADFTVAKMIYKIIGYYLTGKGLVNEES